MANKKIKRNLKKRTHTPLDNDPHLHSCELTGRSHRRVQVRQTAPQGLSPLWQRRKNKQEKPVKTSGQHSNLRLGGELAVV